jgi:2-dehydro-3-deoxyphosphogalactonate aldolase
MPNERTALMTDSLRAALATCPLVAILRGVAPHDAADIGAALAKAGIRILEVPMNSPQPLESIAILSRGLPPCLIGAGTVMSPADVDDVAAAGGRLIVMPHADLAVVRHAKSLDLMCVPGVATPTEAFAALAAGADALKLFPGEMLAPSVLKAMRAVLPKDTLVLPVGGVNEENMAQFWAAGANGFGVGSSLYKPGSTVAEVSARARSLVAKMAELRSASQAA